MYPQAPFAIEERGLSRSLRSLMEDEAMMAEKMLAQQQLSLSKPATVPTNVPEVCR
jgi:hypothetical protein